MGLKKKMTMILKNPERIRKVSELFLFVGIIITFTGITMPYIPSDFIIKHRDYIRLVLFFKVISIGMSLSIVSTAFIVKNKTLSGIMFILGGGILGLSYISIINYICDSCIETTAYWLSVIIFMIAFLLILITRCICYKVKSRG